MHNVVKEGEEGEELLMPIREEHEIILGADDKTTSEYVYWRPYIPKPSC